MPRFSRVGDDAARRGLSPVPGASRAVALPVTANERRGGPQRPPWWQFSRRQFDVIRDQPAPFDARGDSHTASIYLRNVRRTRNVDAADVQSEPRLLAAITVLRWDAQNALHRRTEADARRFAWALRVINGKRTVDWTRYLHRRY